MKKRNDSLRLVVFILILFSLSGLGPSEEHHSVPLDGSYLYDDNPVEASSAPVPEEPIKEAVIHWREEFEIDGKPQVAYFLELNLENPNLEVFPVLSQDRIFGFEFLSEMNLRYEAAATVNAGFNHAYGQPSGLVVQNGRIISGSSGYGRNLLIKDQKAWFLNSSIKTWIQQGEEKLPVDRVNPYPQDRGILIFTPEFGPANRIEGKSTTCIVENNKVVSSEIVSGETDIPDNGYLIVDLRTDNSPLLSFIPGNEVKLSWEGEAEQGYQCSGSLVENGVNTAGENDPWAGSLGIPTPRTAVGIKDASTLIFLVVDGRQPGYSVGVTGKQLADILISVGVTEAALLDGGASSQMIISGETVNRPSTGKERLLASAFIIMEQTDDNSLFRNP